MNRKQALHQHVTSDDNHYYHMSATKSPLGHFHKPQILFPFDILKVEDKGDLKKLLIHYGHNHGVSWMNLVPDTQFARRWFVEKIRPCLRFYCRKYQESIPDWLSDDDYFLKMNSVSKHKLFGSEELKPITFNKFENAGIHDHDEEAGGKGDSKK